MEQITEDYISEKILKFLKKYKFPYNMETAPKGFPTQALVVKWLRIKYNIHFLSQVTFDPKGNWYYFLIYKDGKHKSCMEGADTPEKALNDYILYTLQNLIK